MAPGKHGAGTLATPFDGQRVTLDGDAHPARRRDDVRGDAGIDRGQSRFANAVSRPSRRLNTSRANGAPITLRGEIVDSKCFLGVMVPGEGKTHKDCASLCLRGGIPPAFVVRDREGRSALLLLVSESGGSLAGHAAASRLAGEPIEVTGVIEDGDHAIRGAGSAVGGCCGRTRRRGGRSAPAR